MLSDRKKFTFENQDADSNPTIRVEADPSVNPFDIVSNQTVTIYVKAPRQNSAPPTLEEEIQ
jgi:hypothetical protein